MKSKRALLEKSRLYVILDAASCAPRGVLELAREIALAGADIIQYRNKTAPPETFESEALKIRAILEGSDTLFIVNDHPLVARRVGADGVHVGQDDAPVAAAREIAGGDRIVGVSTHTIGQAKAAAAQGADYLGYGPLFATPTKPEYRPVGVEQISRLMDDIDIPFFVIGDVNHQNINRVVSAGAGRIAVCRAVICSDNVRKAVEGFYRELESGHSAPSVGKKYDTGRAGA